MEFPIKCGYPVSTIERPISEVGCSFLLNGGRVKWMFLDKMKYCNREKMVQNGIVKTDDIVKSVQDVIVKTDGIVKSVQDGIVKTDGTVKSVQDGIVKTDDTVKTDFFK